MKFFHVYNEDFFEGLVKNNLINEDTGFKIQNIFRMPLDKHFNTLAAKGSRLHGMLKDNKYPFYIDRICGGTRYYKFDYDKALVREYAELLGDWFLGFQHHESASNRRRVDWQKILTAMDGHKGPYDKDKLNEKLMNEGSDSFYGSIGKAVSLLDEGNPEDYADLRYAETEEDLLDEFRNMYKARMDDVCGYTFAADSYFLLPKLQEELGMRTFMPEVGWQIAQMRIAVSLARGVMEGAGKLWGLYYEPWIAHQQAFYSLPKYNKDEYETEWFHTKDIYLECLKRATENSGSSRLLQRRIYHYALMAGADYFSEEWGLNSSYSNKKTFELSPYGLVKKDFIDFARNHKTIEARIPFAIVLPLNYKCVQLPEFFDPYHIGEHREDYMACDISAERRKYIGHVEDVLKLFYEKTEEEYGNEGHVMTNSHFGDLFDIIYEDASDEVLGKYKALIDATPDGAFAKAKGDGFRVLESADFDKLSLEVRKLSEDVLDCTVDSLHWILSKDADGKRYVSIFNNEGNQRSEELGDTLIREADARVKVSFKDATDMTAIKLGSEDVKIEKADEKTYYVTVPAAGFAIFEY